MRVCPGFDAEEVSLAGVSGWTTVTSRASGFPAKFGIRTSTGFELLDGIRAAASFLGARFALLAISYMASCMSLCLAMMCSRFSLKILAEPLEYYSVLFHIIYNIWAILRQNILYIEM